MTECEMMACQAPPTRSEKFDTNLKRVKQEGEVHFKGHKASFSAPLHVVILELRNGGLMFRKEFAKKYDLSCEGLNPNWVKMLKDLGRNQQVFWTC